MSTTESKLLHDILLAIGSDENFIFFRNHTGKIQDIRSGRWHTFGLMPGSADIVGISRISGRWVCIEVKTIKGKITIHQERWLKMMEEAGAWVTIARNVEEALNFLKKIKEIEIKEIEKSSNYPRQRSHGSEN